ncbi:MAG: pseudouridine synthase [Amaricoccus sp.]|uniref:pseudouridine synthase n=1 Tax=Amaricoccus sp. TaxID=1872485 RepID=UPI0039E618B5
MSAAGDRDDGGERIARRMARAGVASRRSAEAMIAEGRVSVNGQVIDSPARNVTARDRILVDGQPLAAPEPARLWRYYKPVGLVTSERDEKGRETVFSRLPAEMPRVVSVGRLDLNSEGLLLLTNDGALKRRLELPTTGWLRKYRVRAHGEATDVMLEPLRRGITVDGERFQPMTVTLDRTQGANVWLTVSLREGRNREVRRALEAVGLKVNRLIRVSYGPFQLGELEPGGVEEVRAKVLREQLGLTGAGGPARESGRGASGNGASGNGDSGNGDSGNGGSGNGGSGNGDSGHSGPGAGGKGRGRSGKGASGKGGSGTGASVKGASGKPGKGDSGRGDSGRGNSGRGDSGAAGSGARSRPGDAGGRSGVKPFKAASKSPGKAAPGAAAGGASGRAAGAAEAPGSAAKRGREYSHKPHSGGGKPAATSRGKPGKPLTPAPRRPK